MRDSRTMLGWLCLPCTLVFLCCYAATIATVYASAITPPTGQLPADFYKAAVRLDGEDATIAWTANVTQPLRFGLNSTRRVLHSNANVSLGATLAVEGDLWLHAQAAAGPARPSVVQPTSSADDTEQPYKVNVLAMLLELRDSLQTLRADHEQLKADYESLRVAHEALARDVAGHASVQDDLRSQVQQEHIIEVPDGNLSSIQRVWNDLGRRVLTGPTTIRLCANGLVTHRGSGTLFFGQGHPQASWITIQGSGVSSCTVIFDDISYDTNPLTGHTMAWSFVGVKGLTLRDFTISGPVHANGDYKALQTWGALYLVSSEVTYYALNIEDFHRGVRLEKSRFAFADLLSNDNAACKVHRAQQTSLRIQLRLAGSTDVGTHAHAKNSQVHLNCAEFYGSSKRPIFLGSRSEASVAGLAFHSFDASDYQFHIADGSWVTDGADSARVDNSGDTTLSMAGAEWSGASQDSGCIGGVTSSIAGGLNDCKDDTERPRIVLSASQFMTSVSSHGLSWASDFWPGWTSDTRAPDGLTGQVVCLRVGSFGSCQLSVKMDNAPVAIPYSTHYNFAVWGPMATHYSYNNLENWPLTPDTTAMRYSGRCSAFAYTPSADTRRMVGRFDKTTMDVPTTGYGTVPVGSKVVGTFCSWKVFEVNGEVYYRTNPSGVPLRVGINNFGDYDGSPGPQPLKVYELYFEIDAHFKIAGY